MSPEYRRRLDNVLRSAYDLPALIGPSRKRLKDSNITFVETVRGAYRVIAISGTSTEWWFDANGSYVGTAEPGSATQTFLRASIAIPEVRNPVSHICAGCSREFSSWQDHDFAGCVGAALQMAR